MDIDRQLSECRKIARTLHDGQMRYDGVTPYISHVEKVVNTVGKDKYLQCVAWLHDTIEDTDVDLETFESLGIERGIISRTLVLTHKPEDTYNEYIRIIRDTPLSGCVKVKIADIVSNLSDEPSHRQIDKYYKALLILGNVIQ